MYQDHRLLHAPVGGGGGVCARRGEGEGCVCEEGEGEGCVCDIKWMKETGTVNMQFCFQTEQNMLPWQQMPQEVRSQV